MFRDEVFDAATSRRQRTHTYRRSIDVIATILVTYYWILQFTRGDSIEILSPEFAFYLYVGPAAGFAFIGLLYMVFNAEALNRATVMLFTFCAIVVVVSIARSDYRSIASLGLFGISLAVLFQLKIKISINTINILFILAPLITTTMFFLGYGIYTFIPSVGAFPDPWWRISPYPSVAEGALLAMFVFTVNLLGAGQKLRTAIILLSGYFIVFSGNRTAIIASLVIVAYVFLIRKAVLYTRFSRILFIATLIILLVLSIYTSEIFMSLPLADSGILRSLIFRDDAISGADFGGQVGSAAVRKWVFDQHLAAFMENPFIGIGTFDLSALNTGYEALDNSGTGSEAFVTGMLARMGLVSVIMFAAIFLVRQPLQGVSAELSTAMKVGLLIAMITYGSFVNAYDVVFFLMIVTVAGGVEFLPRRSDLRSRDGSDLVRVGQ